MRRTLLAIAGLLTLASPAAADPESHCGGAYAEAASLVDAALSAYGTLYSGGDHFHRVDSVGATLDLYRFWRSLPDIGLRRFEAPSGSRVDGEIPSGWNRGVAVEAVEDVWARVRWALSPDTPAEATMIDIVWAGHGFDLLTSPGPTPDWWRHAGDFEDLTPWQLWVADMAETEPLLDWLQTILAASDAPWANLWHLSRGVRGDVLEGYRRLGEAAFQRFEAGDGIEWLVAAALNDPDQGHAAYSQWHRSLLQELQEIGTDVSRCEASPQAYGAYAIALLAPGPGRRAPDLIDDVLPRTVREALAANRLYDFALRVCDARFDEVDDAFAAFRALFPEDPDWIEMVDLAQLYAAEKLEQVPLSNHPYVRRAYNLLSADDIAELAQREGLDAPLARAAYARHVALGNWERAEALLPLLVDATPENAANIERIWQMRQPPSVRLALIVLETPNLSSVITRPPGEAWPDLALRLHAGHMAHQRNLPREYAHGGVLQRDFETWLRLPQRWHAFGVAGSRSIRWIQRVHRRHGLDGPTYRPAPQLIPDGPSVRGANFEGLIAWGEIGHLATDARLMHTVARVIVDWADRRTDTRWESWFSDRETESRALAALIRLCQFDSCGEINGVPAQQRAFWLLHMRLPDSEATRETPHWWESPLGR